MAIGPPLDDSWGAVLIGVFLAIFLYGLLTLQVYVYQEMFPRDAWWQKVIVATVWILDTLHTIAISHMIYTNLITNFGDYVAVGHNTWSFNVNVLITTIVAAISQVFFIHRCWRFDKSVFNTVASGIILGFAGVQFAFGSLCTHLTFMLSQYAQFLDYKWAVDTWLGSAAVTDILVSCALVRSLLMKRNEVQRTRNLIEQLIRWTVTTGLITSVWALLDLAVFTGSETTLIHLFFNIMLAKLYANTLLASLNHRSPNRPERDSLPPPNRTRTQSTQANSRSSISLGGLGRSRASRTLTLTTTTTMNSAAAGGRRGTGTGRQSVSFALDSQVSSGGAGAGGGGYEYDFDLLERGGVRVDVQTSTTLSSSGRRCESPTELKLGSGSGSQGSLSESMEMEMDEKDVDGGGEGSPGGTSPSEMLPTPVSVMQLPREPEKALCLLEEEGR